MRTDRGRRRIVSVGVWAALAFLLGGQGQASAANVLLFSTSYGPYDMAIQSGLQGLGHTVVIGPQYTTFNGSNPDLSGFDAVLLVPSYNYAAGDMPAAGQTALLTFISAGGGLITGEWIVWKEVAQGSFMMLRDAVPVVPNSVYRGDAAVTYTTDTPDDILNAGVDPAFTFTADNVSGTETLFAPKDGAIVFYDSDYQAGAAGVIGWRYGAGGVISISTVIGSMEVGNSNYGQLLANAVTWVATPQ